MQTCRVALPAVGIVTMILMAPSIASPLTIVSDVSAAGDITLTASDSAVPGDDLTINGGVTVASTGGWITLNAGDNLNHQALALISSPVGLTFNLDSTDADPGLGAALMLFGDLDAPNLTINGGPDADTFDIVLDDNTPITLFGGAPGSGDTLNIVGGGGLLTVTGVDSGTIVVPGTQPLTFSGVETVTGVTIVPEPASTVLFMIGASGLLRRRRPRS